MTEQQNSSGRISLSPVENSTGQQTNSHETVENIRVAVRLRPFTQRERQANSKRIVDIEQNTVVLHHPKSMNRVKKFTFDYSYWSHDGFKRDANGLNVPDLSHINSDKYVDQDRVFQDLGRFLLENCVKGYNSALLAYGQTGSGKSYTVSGYGQNEGILSRFARELFIELDKQAVEKQQQKNGNNQENNNSNNNNNNNNNKSQVKQEFQGGKQQYKYEIYFSMLEIYNEVVRDLLAKSHGHTVPATVPRRGLKVREHPRHGFFAEGLTTIRCSNRHEIETRIEEGQLNKSIASTSMNETSSRGHTIYKFTIKQLNWDKRLGQDITTTSIVQLVDLAGNERTSLPPLINRSISPAPASPISTMISGANNKQQHPVSSSPVANISANSGTSRQHTSGIKHHQQLSQRFRESVSINQSLSALGNCIQILSQNSQLASTVAHGPHSMSSSSSSSSAMSHPQHHIGQESTAMPSGIIAAPTKRQKVPYRDSVLTKLLNNCCLSGNSKTVIIATLSPADSNYDDTLSTLRFADRAKQIKTHAHINEIKDEAQLMHSLRKENQRLKEMVDRRSHRSDDSSQTSNFDETESVMENFTGSRIGKLVNGAISQTPTTTAATAISKHQRLAPIHSQPVAVNQSYQGAKRAGNVTSTPKKMAPKPPATAMKHPQMNSGSQQQEQQTKQRQQQLKNTTVSNNNEQLKSKNSTNKQIGVNDNTIATKIAPSQSALSNMHHKRLSRDTEIEDETPEMSEQDQLATKDAASNNVKNVKIKNTSLPVATSEGDEVDGNGGPRRDDNDAESDIALDEADIVDDEEEEEEEDDEDEDEEDEEDDEEIDMEMELENGEELFRDDITSPSDNSIANGVIEDELSEIERIDLVNKTISNKGQIVNGHTTMAATEETASNKRTTGTKLNTSNSKKINQQTIPTEQATKTSNNTSNNNQLSQQRHNQPSMRRVSLIASELKLHHPHLSNLNADEQLSGKLSYIIKPGTTSLGKNDSCDIVLRGLDIRANHATIIYDQSVTAISANQHEPPLKRIYIEPALDSIDEQPELQQRDNEEQRQPEVLNNPTVYYSAAPIFVNGASIKTRTELHHCDRILFGTNVYFVFVDNSQQQQQQQQQEKSNKDGQPEDQLWPDSITYDMARAEVLKNKMLNDGLDNSNILRDLLMQSTGAKRDKLGLNGRLSSAKSLRSTTADADISGNTFRWEKSRPKSAAATMSDQYDQQTNGRNKTGYTDKEYYTIKENESDTVEADQNVYLDEEDKDMDNEFSEQIRLDTAELAWQVEEVNKIAKEMDIKLEYELCVLTGAEQLIAPIEMDANWFDQQSNYTKAMMQSAMSKLSHSSSRSSSKSSSIVNEATQMFDNNMSQVTSRASSSFRSNTTLDSNQNNSIGSNYYTIRRSPHAINDDDDNQDGEEEEVGEEEATGEEEQQQQQQQSATSVASKQTITDLNKVDASRIPAAVFVKVKTGPELGMEFYWSKDKFIDRRFKIQDLYGVYSFDNGGRQAIIAYLIEQSNHQPIIDPFFDDPRYTFVLIGHVQLILQPLSHLVDIDQEYDIIDVDDRVAGTINIRAIPCYENDDKYYPFTSKELEENILDDPNELIGRKLAFMLKILSCHKIDEKYTSVYCQYMLHLDSNVARTDFVSVRERETHDLIFNHVHYITFEEISHETLNILRYGTMTIQVVGRYVYDEINSKPISTVFSIVNSINKHRAKLSQQQQQQHHNHHNHHHHQQQQQKQKQQQHYDAMIGNHSGTLTSVASKSGASSTASTNMVMDGDDVDEGVGVQPHEIIIDAILTKRKLDRAENQLHYLRRTVNIAEHYNKKQIPVKTVRKLLSSYSNDLDNSIEDVTEVTDTKKSQHVSKTCVIS